MDKLYEKDEPVGIRVVFAPEKEYRKDQNGDMAHTVPQNPKAYEALMIASDSLAQAMKRTGKSRKHDDLSAAVLKYDIRRTTRPTPYGLFSGVDACRFADQTDLTIRLSESRKRTRVDMGWLYHYIDKILDNGEIRKHVRVKMNNHCFKSGNRLWNTYFTAGGAADKKTDASSSVRYTPPLAFLIENAAEYITFADLCRRLMETFGVFEEKARKYLDELLENGYLLAEIYPPALNTQPLDYVIQILEKTDAAAEELYYLKDLERKLIQFDGIQMGEGVSCYEAICESMKDKSEGTSYLQIDCRARVKGRGISAEVGTEIEKAANMLNTLLPANAEFSFLTKYKEEFLEKYGYCTEVPVMEMLDEVQGVGIPANYAYSLKNSVREPVKNPKVDAVRSLIHQKMAGISAGESVELTDGELAEALKDTGDSDRNQLLLSFEIFATLLAESEEDINRGNFQLQLSGCKFSSGALNSFGRFADLFTSTEVSDSEILQREQELLGEDYLIAELLEQPRQGALANINMGKSGADYQIALGMNACNEKQEIAINDIYIGVDPDTNAFYAKSKKWNKRIYARTTHMMNYVYGSSVFRFLRDISSIAGKFQMYEAFKAFEDDKMPYYPRIIYGKCILSPARWLMKGEVLKKRDYTEWKELFQSWCEKWDTPEYVHLVEGDNYLRLDLNRESHIQLLYEYVKKLDRIILEEALDIEKNLWLCDENGDRHCCELVFPFVRINRNLKDIKKENPLVDTIRLRTEKEPYENETFRSLFPGEMGWYYYRIYGVEKRVEEFLSCDLAEFMDILQKEHVITQHFFIRYKDMRHHVRLRLSVGKGNDTILLQRMGEWLIAERKKGILSDFALVPYDREIERYGGKKLIRYAEDCFCGDSILVERILQMSYFKSWKYSKEEIAVWVISGMMKGFGLNLREQEEWMSHSVKSKEYRDVYRKNENGYRDSILLTEADVSAQVFSAYRERNSKIRRYAKKIEAEITEGSLANDRDSILSSMIHMFCNRYMADNEWERKVRALTRHSLYSMLQYRKHQKGNVSWDI